VQQKPPPCARYTAARPASPINFRSVRSAGAHSSNCCTPLLNRTAPARRDFVASFPPSRWGYSLHRLRNSPSTRPCSSHGIRNPHRTKRCHWGPRLPCSLIPRCNRCCTIRRTFQYRCSSRRSRVSSCLRHSCFQWIRSSPRSGIRRKHPRKWAPLHHHRRRRRV